MAEKEYIEREAAYKACEAYFSGVCVYDVSASEVINDFEEVIDAVPTADVAPVKHGHWIPQFVSKRGLSDHFMCSECAESTFTPRKFEMIKYAYCPNCGAKLC